MEKNINYIWYSGLEEPDEQREILVEYISKDTIKHDVVYYHKDTDSFWKDSSIINDVTKWCYFDELIKLIGKLSCESYYINEENNDERLRKTTISFLKDFAEQGYENAVECIDWLKNQVEQKHSDKVESKFEIEKGKWYVCNTSRYTDFIVGKAYYCPKNGMLKPNENEIARYVAKDCFHLWSIADAKDSDILVYNDSIFIFNEIYKNHLIYYGIYECNKKFHNDKYYSFLDLGIINTNNIYPATKEECECLFQKMKEVGYTFDFEKKELKKINSYCQEHCKGYQETGRCFADGDCKDKREAEQKSFDKIKSKFNVGDWITNGNAIYHISNIRDDGFYCFDYGPSSDMIQYIDNTCHLWTVDDATDGDILSYVTDEDDLWIMIYWSLYKPYEGHVHYHALLVNNDFSDKGTCCICIDNLKPATKEQCDLLFSKMKNAGYEYNEDKKELKKIVQNPIANIELKFHKGDWVVWDNKISCHIDNIYQGKESLIYTITDTNNMTRSYSVKNFDNNAHLWTVQDAKDGDVLYLQHDGKDHIIIYKGIIKERFRTFISAYCAYNSIVNDFCFTDVSKYGDIAYGVIMPATKEQRDVFFTKIKKAGYKWDSKNKKLKLLITNGGDFESENCIQKTTKWNEEDEIRLNRICKTLWKNRKGDTDEIFQQEQDIDWLKSLKQRIE